MPLHLGWVYRACQVWTVLMVPAGGVEAAWNQVECPTTQGTLALTPGGTPPRPWSLLGPAPVLWQWTGVESSLRRKIPSPKGR